MALPCQELERQLKDEPVWNIDETGWRTNGDKRYLGAFVAARYVVYTVAATRGKQPLRSESLRASQDGRQLTTVESVTPRRTV